jgi:lipid A 3-O-deacylase
MLISPLFALHQDHSTPNSDRLPMIALAWAVCLLAAGAVQAQTADEQPPATTSAGATASAASPWQFRLYWENDGIFNLDGNQDRHYTNGMVLTATTQPRWVDQLFNDIGLPAQRTAAGFGVGHQVHTATKISGRIPPSKDYPYSGYLYGSFYVQRENEFLQTGIPSLDHVQIDLGIIGPSAHAKWLQKNFHSTFNTRTPNGWNTQLSDEVAAQLYYRKKWLIDLPEFLLNDVKSLQGHIIPQAALALGTVHRFIELGSTYRVGWNLPDDFGLGRLGDYVSATGSGLAQPGRVTFYIFGRAAVQFVEWDTFVDGNVYHNSRFAGSQPIVGHFQFGAMLAGQWKQWTGQISYAITFPTDRYRGQTTHDSYATMMFAVSRPW